MDTDSEGDPYAVIDCLLPGQIRRLGTITTFVTARRPIKTTGEDCAIRGGEYVASDRASLASSLRVWQDPARGGNPKAQYYVGTIYEKGIHGNPDYTLAATWYRKAADQGFSRAAINLGRLYEQGLGVDRNSSEAFKWYVHASGLDRSSLTLLTNQEASGQILKLKQTVGQREQEIEMLRQQLNSVNQELSDLRGQLQQQQSQADAERQNLQVLQSQFQNIQVELDRARAKPDQQAAIREYENQLQVLQEEVGNQQRTVDDRGRDVMRLQDHIVRLERDAARRVQEIQGEASGKIQRLEQTVAVREQEIGRLREDLGQVNQELAGTRSSLDQYTVSVETERQRLQQVEQNYERVKAELTEARAKMVQQDIIARYEEELRALRMDVAHRQEKVKEQNQEIARLNENVVTLEREVANRAQEFSLLPINDLGFEGPTIEIIDPPLLISGEITRGNGGHIVPIPIGIRHFIAGRVLAPAGLQRLLVNGQPVPLDDNGIFSLEVPPLSIDQRGMLVEILAIDIQNKRAVARLVMRAKEAVPAIQPVHSIDLTPIWSLPCAGDDRMGAISCQFLSAFDTSLPAGFLRPLVFNGCWSMDNRSHSTIMEFFLWKYPLCQSIKGECS